MKKIIAFIVFFMLLTNLHAQEVIVIGGAGINQTDSIAQGNFGFAQARLMFNLSDHFRIGPYLGFTQYASTELHQNPNSVLLGREFAYGASLDSYGPMSYYYSYYFWLNMGIKNVADKCQSGYFNSTTLTDGAFLSGGLFITDDSQGWFGNNRLMVEYQKPYNASVNATWKGEKITVQAYNKEAINLVFEGGIKRFGVITNFEPLIHIGGGRDFGRDRNYWELGGGFDFGIFKEYYRDILKAKVFWREDFKNSYNNFSSRTPSGCLGGEIVFNASAFISAISNKKK